MTQTPNQPEREAEATPDNDIDEILGLETSPDGEPHHLLTRDDAGNIIEGVDYSEEVAALTRNRDIYAVKARIDEHGVLEALGVGPFPLRLAELRAELATLEGNDHD